MERKFRLIDGGLSKEPVEGPISRLGLLDRYKPLTKTQLAWIFIPKLILLATVVYLIFVGIF